MNMKSMLTPIGGVTYLRATDTVRDAYDRLESHDLPAAPLVDANGTYLGTVTEADLRHHLAGRRDRAMAFETPLSQLERHAKNPPVTPDQSLGTLAMRACSQGFVPVVDGAGKLLGVIDRRKVSALRAS
jgi:CBS-domain-containing membrane protein